MPSQFEKRKSKSSAELVKEVEAKLEEIKQAPEFTQTGLDIYTNDGGKSYAVAEINYNPETGEAKVSGTYNITRIVALKYNNMKTALHTLKKGKK